MYVQLVTKTTGVGKYSELNSEEIISAIARHGVIKEDNGKLVKYLMDNSHWSPLNMVNFTFEVQTSRAIGRQILRHSSIKFQEHSQRYSNKVEFEPIELRKEDKKNRQSSTEIFNPDIRNVENDGFMSASQVIQNILFDISVAYENLIQAGVAKECARFILPECTQSTLSANGTLRSWLSFLNVRLNEHAQKECREVANEILKILKDELPNVFANLDTDNGLFM